MSLRRLTSIDLRLSGKWEDGWLVSVLDVDTVIGSDPLRVFRRSLLSCQVKSTGKWRTYGGISAGVAGLLCQASVGGAGREKENFVRGLSAVGDRSTGCGSGEGG